MRNVAKNLMMVGVFIGLAVGLTGCAGTPMTDRLHATPPAGMPRATELVDVPFFAQTEYHCGPAALATALNATGLKTEPTALAKDVYTPGREGTLQTEILSGARRHGRLALPVKGMQNAFEQVADGRPVLILQNLGLDIAPAWHYAVLVGYDLNGKTVTLRSGTTERMIMGMETLEHTWSRADFWGLTFHKPTGPIPEGTDMAGWMQAATGLERSGRTDDAMRAFETAVRHWPKSAAPLVSLANVQIREDRLTKARGNLQRALVLEPSHPVALNNMAHVLLHLNRLHEAETYALKAVDVGGRSEDVAKRTLAEIRAAIDKEQQSAVPGR